MTQLVKRPFGPHTPGFEKIHYLINPMPPLVELTTGRISEPNNDLSFVGNGTVDFNEFLSLIVPTQKESPQNNLLEAFRAFDVNGDGYISKEELKEGLHILGEMVTDAELNELIHKIDSDNDGQIRYAGLMNTHFKFRCYANLFASITSRFKNSTESENRQDFGNKMQKFNYIATES